jgi:hypothetical protein
MVKVLKVNKDSEQHNATTSVTEVLKSLTFSVGINDPQGASPELGLNPARSICFLSLISPI